MSLPSQTYYHYTRQFQKTMEGLKWESRLRFVRSLYRLYPLDKVTSVTEVKKIILHSAFCVSYLDMCFRTYLTKSDQELANNSVSQILKLMDSIFIRLLAVPKRNKILVQNFVTQEFPKFFTDMENIMCDIEVLLVATDAPLHRYSVK